MGLDRIDPNKRIGLMFDRPWTIDPLSQWDICAMNHYHINGRRMLFVAMTKDGDCMIEEGEDDEYVWKRLLMRAKNHQPLQQKVYAWLGAWRDHLDPEMTANLQSILGALNIKSKSIIPKPKKDTSRSFKG